MSTTSITASKAINASSKSNINGPISSSGTLNQPTDPSECNSFNESDNTIDNLFNPFRASNSLSNSLSSSFGQSKIMDSHVEPLKSLNLLNSSFSNSLLNNSDFSANNNNHNGGSTGATLQCGICGKYPMVNGKTLVGCLHSFCHSCLIQSTFSSSSLLSNSSVIACPICSQETLIPTGGVDALMPHYSNTIHDLNNNNPGTNNNFMVKGKSIDKTLIEVS